MSESIPTAPEELSDKTPKAVLLRHIEELSASLTETTTKLDNCQSQLEAIENQQQEKDGKIGELDKELSDTKNELEKDLAKLKQDNTELGRQVKTLKKDNEKLTQKTKELNDSLKKEKERAQSKQKELESQINQLKKKLEEHERESQNESETQSSEREQIEDTKSTFRIDIYPYQNKYLGKIEHTLSKDKRTLSSLNSQEIINFISAHLPSHFENGNISKDAKEQFIHETNKNTSPKAEAAKPSQKDKIELTRPLAGQVLQEIQIEQTVQNEERNGMNTFMANNPMKVKLKCHIPELMSKKPIFYKPFSFYLTVKDQITGERKFDYTNEQELVKEKTDYSGDFDIPQIKSGTYYIDSYLHIPTFEVSEHDRISIDIR